MPIIKWDPFNIDFEEAFPFTRDLAADVYEKDGNVIVEMHAPGIKLEDINIDVEDTYLHVYGFRIIDEEKKEANFYYKEIRHGDFERVISLPAKVVANKAQATLKNGVLRVVLPKQQEETSGKVRIKVSQ